MTHWLAVIRGAVEYAGSVKKLRSASVYQASKIQNVPQGRCSDERVGSCTTNPDQLTAKERKEQLNNNLLENELHSLPANEPKPTPPQSAGTIVAASAINHIVNIKLKRTPRDFPMSY